MGQQSLGDGGLAARRCNGPILSLNSRHAARLATHTKQRVLNIARQAARTRGKHLARRITLNVLPSHPVSHSARRRCPLVHRTATLRRPSQLSLHKPRHQRSRTAVYRERANPTDSEPRPWVAAHAARDRPQVTIAPVCHPACSSPHTDRACHVDLRVGLVHMQPAPRRRHSGLDVASFLARVARLPSPCSRHGERERVPHTKLPVRAQAETGTPRASSQLRTSDCATWTPSLVGPRRKSGIPTRCTSRTSILPHGLACARMAKCAQIQQYEALDHDGTYTA